MLPKIQQSGFGGSLKREHVAGQIISNYLSHSLGISQKHDQKKLKSIF